MIGLAGALFMSVSGSIRYERTCGTFGLAFGGRPIETVLFIGLAPKALRINARIISIMAGGRVIQLRLPQGLTDFDCC